MLNSEIIAVCSKIHTKHKYTVWAERRIYFYYTWRYLERIRDEITEFQRTGRYKWIYTKTNGLSWKENQGIQNTGIENSVRNIIMYQRHLLKMWENYITELCDWADRSQNLEIETEEQMDEDEKDPHILHRDVEKKNYQENKVWSATVDDGFVPVEVLNFFFFFCRRWSQNKDTTDQQHMWNSRVDQAFHWDYKHCLKEEARKL
jgi:hypothetical protein